MGDSFSFPGQVQPAVDKINNAFASSSSDGTEVTPKEYQAAADKFASVRKGGLFERGVGAMLETVYKNNVQGREAAFAKAFNSAEPEVQLMAKCIAAGKSYDQFKAELEGLREE